MLGRGHISYYSEYGHMGIWRGHKSYYSEYVLSSTLSIYSTLIAIVLIKGL